MKPVMVPATREHAVALAANMRLEDCLEIKKAFPEESNLDAIIRSINGSTDSWTVFFGEHIACMFGIQVPPIGTRMSPWCLTTPLVDKFPKTFYRESKNLKRLMLERYPHVISLCDANYAKTVRWLTRLGFTLTGPIPIGPNNAPFYVFEARA